jgi:hypothetical protein
MLVNQLQVRAKTIIGRISDRHRALPEELAASFVRAGDIVRKGKAYACSRTRISSERDRWNAERVAACASA